MPISSEIFSLLNKNDCWSHFTCEQFILHAQGDDNDILPMVGSIACLGRTILHITVEEMTNDLDHFYKTTTLIPLQRY